MATYRFFDDASLDWRATSRAALPLTARAQLECPVDSLVRLAHNRCLPTVTSCGHMLPKGAAG